MSLTLIGFLTYPHTKSKVAQEIRNDWKVEYHSSEGYKSAFVLQKSFYHGWVILKIAKKSFLSLWLVLWSIVLQKVS